MSKPRCWGALKHTAHLLLKVLNQRVVGGDGGVRLVQMTGHLFGNEPNVGEQSQHHHTDEPPCQLNSASEQRGLDGLRLGAVNTTSTKPQSVPPSSSWCGYSVTFDGTTE